MNPQWCKLAVLGLGLAGMLLPTAAAACPQCAANNAGGLGTFLLLGSMILLPFAAALIVVRIIKHGDTHF